MSIVAVLGDASTTTALALSAVWPAGIDGGRDVLVVEADPSGGSAAAWLDLPIAPSLSTVVTRVGEGGWASIDGLARPTPWGARLIPAPVRSLEASRSVAEADRFVYGLLADPARPVSIVDLGRVLPTHGPPPALRRADLAVLVHRQARASARAAAVRIDRFAEVVDMARTTVATVVVAVVGDQPFDVAEVADFVTGESDAPGAGGSTTAVRPPVVELAEDPLSAAVIAGRSGVSTRRFLRLPLARSMATLASTIEAVLPSATDSGAPWREVAP